MRNEPYIASTNFYAQTARIWLISLRRNKQTALSTTFSNLVIKRKEKKTIVILTEYINESGGEMVRQRVK